MALIVADRVQETCNSPGVGVVTLLGAVAQFQTFSAAIGNGNTTFYVIADQTGTNWEVGIGTYATTGNTLTRTTILASSNAGSAVNFASGTQNVWGDLPADKAIYKDASGNAIGLGTPASFVGTNITGTASGLTAGNVTTNANLTGAVTSTGNATLLGSFTSLQLATALTNETGTGSAVFSDNASLLNPTYTGTLTGGTGIVAIGTNQIYKDASGNVGIGITSPAAKLQINHAAVSTYNALQIGDLGTPANNTGIYLRTNGTAGISWGGGSLAFFADSAGTTERMRINNAGDVTLQGNISVGGATPTTSGTGITFPAAQSASSDANTLDDYEEGTWTPVLTSGFTTTGTVTRSGFYTKIGNQVTVKFLIQATTNSVAAGAVMSGLPFAGLYSVGLSVPHAGGAVSMSLTSATGVSLTFSGVSISAPNLIGSIVITV